MAKQPEFNKYLPLEEWFYAQIMMIAAKKGNHIKRVGVIFSGGPAPAANSVISSLAISFIA